jgi:hypothetical protein
MREPGMAPALGRVKIHTMEPTWLFFTPTPCRKVMNRITPAAGEQKRQTRGAASQSPRLAHDKHRQRQGGNNSAAWTVDKPIIILAAPRPASGCHPQEQSPFNPVGGALFLEAMWGNKKE